MHIINKIEIFIYSNIFIILAQMENIMKSMPIDIQDIIIDYIMLTIYRKTEPFEGEGKFEFIDFLEYDDINISINDHKKEATNRGLVCNQIITKNQKPFV